jgi:hypothetical protein
MKKTCSKCYQKFEEEDMVLNKSDAYSFCVNCHKEYVKEKQAKNKKRADDEIKRGKKLEECKYPLMKASFPYFLTGMICLLVLIVVY